MTSFPRITILIALTFVLAIGSAVARDARIVAVGDVHGEYDGLVSILQTAGLVDAKLRWSGGAARLVQTGDFLDRGADVRKVMDLLMRLEKEAKKKRGDATILAGNHELMNLTGYLRDVNPAAYAAFADRKAEKRRADGYKLYLRLIETRSKRYGESFVPMPAAEWMAQHPPGFIEYQAALGPDGKYGRWLRARNAVARIDRIVFLHGGLSPARSSNTLQEINDQVHREMVAYDRIKAYLVQQGLLLPFSNYDEMIEAIELELKLRAARGELERDDDLGRVIHVARGIQQWTIYHPDGPLWFRGFLYWTDAEGEPLVADLLKAYDADHIVVGHSIPPDPSRILPRFGGKIFLIDTGMLRGYAKGGRPSALEVDSRIFTAIYANERIVLLDKRGDAPAASPQSRRIPSSEIHLVSWRGAEIEPRWADPRGRPLPFRTNADVEAFLRNATFVSSNRKRLWGITKPQKLVVKNGRVRAHAVFRSHHVAKENTQWEDGTPTEFLFDSYRADIAAYEVGLLLGIDNIPPTVSWRMKGEEGSLQIFVENAKPLSSNFAPKDPVRWRHQSEMMEVFDALIQNLDRHAGNLLIGADESLWMIDHTRSFGRGKEIHNAEKVRRCDRRAWERLRALDAETLHARLAPYLGPKEIDALLVRKEALIRLLEARIEQEGEASVLFTEDETPPPHPSSTRRRDRSRTILLAAQQTPAPAATTSVRRWIGPEGELLPFTTEDEILHFLENAKVIKSFDIPVGVTQPRKVLLELDGIQAHAVFRDVKVDKRNVRLDDGKFVFYLRDNYISEVAAYRLGKLLGIDAIPPVVERSLFHKEGSLQLWVEKAMTESKRKEKKLEPPDLSSWRRQLHTILVFDNLVNNIDRNMGNMLIDAEWKVWMIDHTRTFGRDRQLPSPKNLARCPRRVWKRLTTVDDKTIRQAMSPYMGRYEIDALLERRQKIIDLLKKRMEKEGEAKVLFGEDDAIDEPVVPPPPPSARLQMPEPAWVSFG